MLWTPDSNAHEALGYRLTFVRSEVSVMDLTVSSQMAGRSHETEIKRTAAAHPKGGGRRRGDGDFTAVKYIRSNIMPI